MNATEASALVKRIGESISPSLDIENQAKLQEYLQQLQTHLEQQTGASPDPLPVEIFKAVNDFTRESITESYRARRESGSQLFGSVVSAGQSALKASMIINGGSAAAVLAFAGHLAGVKPASVSQVAVPLLWFCGGLLAVLLSHGLVYLGQYHYHKAFSAQDEISGWLGGFFNLGSNILASLSYLTFAAGCWFAYNTLVGLK